MAEIRLPRSLASLFPELPRRVELDATTVGEAIDGLDRRWPGVRDRLCDAGPVIREHINVFVDGEPATLATPVSAGTIVHVIPAVSGGAAVDGSRAPTGAAVAFDPTRLRREFPALAMEQDGRPLVFLDGPGGTQVPDRVIEAASAYLRSSNANTGGAFATSMQTDRMLTQAHAAAADLLGAASPGEITFGANMTTLTFAFSRSIGVLVRPGDEIVVTTLDHEANVSPWRALEERGAILRTVDIHPEDGTLDLDDLDRKLGPRTRLVAVGYASNALGTINPVAEIVRRAHAVGAWTYVDAVHYAPHGPIDVRALGTDFLACSAYKFFGPHVGIVYARDDLLASLPLYKVRPSHGRFETGTLNHEGIAGTAAAIEYLASVGDAFGNGPAGTGRPLRDRLVAGLTAIAAYERELAGRLLAGLAGMPAVRVWGITDPGRAEARCPTVAITIRGSAPRTVAEVLARAGILAWDGDFYAQALIERLGLAESGGVVRLGLVHYNTADEVDRTLEALGAIAAARD